MRVALVQCPPWGSLPPLGLATLKAYLELHGHETQCFDLNIDYARERHQELLTDVGGSVYARPDPFASESFAEWDYEFDGEVRFSSSLQERPLPIDRWVDQVLDRNPEVVGFSIQATNLGVSLQVAQQISTRDPSVRLVFGGPNVAQAQNGAKALATGIPEAVVEGEGEETLLALLDAFERDQDLAEVAGIGRLVDGRPKWNDPRPLLSDIDALPFPDFSDFDWSEYPNPYEIPIMASRGCVLNCAFCYETVYWKRFRTQSAPRIVAEIQHQLANHPLRADVEHGSFSFALAFADSLVNGHLGGLKRMSELLAESPADVTWGGQATINTKMDNEFFAKLRASGCTGLSFGLESGSQHVLESMGKRFQIAEASEFLARVHRADINVVVNVMVGFPTETRADFVQTLRFLAKVRRLIFMVNNVSPTGIPGGSRIHGAPEEFGVTPVDLVGWNSGIDFKWESEATGTEADRERRLKVLHVWMTLLRIPHQRRAVSPSRWPNFLRRSSGDESVEPTAWRKSQPEPAPPPEPVSMPAAETQTRIKRLAESLGEQPLVIEATGGMVDRAVTSPPWAVALAPQTWTGLSFLDLRVRLASHLGGDLCSSEAESADGVVEVTIEVADPQAGALTGLRLEVFPPPTGSQTQVFAFFPLGVRAAAR